MRDGATVVHTTDANECSVQCVSGGQQYPIHPLDLFQFSKVPIISPDGDNETAYVCSATYQGSTLNPATPVDYILGDASLRSVYASYMSSRLCSWFSCLQYNVFMCDIKVRLWQL